MAQTRRPALEQRAERAVGKRRDQLEVLARAERQLGPGRTEVRHERLLDRDAVQPDVRAAAGHVGDPLHLDEQAVADVPAAAHPGRDQAQALRDPRGR